MKKRSKRYTEWRGKVETTRRYNPSEAFDLLAQGKKCKFNESVDVSIRLGVDPKQADQMVRGTAQLPHGTGREVRVLVITKGEKEIEAKEAGADFVGGEDLIQKIQGGWLDFDKMIATPDMMGSVGKLGKVLGPRGLMPNPKSGTVTLEVAKAVKGLKSGTIEFRVDKAGIIHTIAGRSSFSVEQLKENFTTLMDSIVRAKPASSKGVYIKSVAISTTMGPGIKIDPNFYRTI